MGVSLLRNYKITHFFWNNATKKSNLLIYNYFNHGHGQWLMAHYTLGFIADLIRNLLQGCGNLKP